MRFDITSSEEFPWGFFILWTLVWVGTLARILSRSDLDTLNKLLWTVVVVFVPFFGVFLYAFLAPARVSSRQTASQSSGTGGPNTPKQGPNASRSDVYGTPWAGNPHFTND